MGIEFLTGPNPHKICYVKNQGLLDVAAIFGAHERCGRSSFHRERGNRIDYFLLQPQQVRCRFNHNTRKTNRWRRNVVVLVRLQLSAGRLLVANQNVRIIRWLDNHRSCQRPLSKPRPTLKTLFWRRGLPLLQRVFDIQPLALDNSRSCAFDVASGSKHIGKSYHYSAVNESALLTQSWIRWIVPFGPEADICVLITQQAYVVLSFLPYLARVELQDPESPAPNMHIQPSVRGLTWSLLSHEATQPTFCTQCSVSCVGNGSSHPTVATYASADHKFNAEPSSPLSLHHRWMCPLGVKSRHVRRKRQCRCNQADAPLCAPGI